MSHFNYGGRIGLSTTIRLTIKLCDIYMKNITKIKSFINASMAITAPQKVTVIAWLDGIADACEILKILQVSYEH